ncbi:S41 family peptidase [Hwanghaeella sp.]|uniref:S41 family peptidase n=1 Tax=Hwanghaeella sp. TaxID=2605943 RepID=UPI003CCC060E
MVAPFGKGMKRLLAAAALAALTACASGPQQPEPFTPTLTTEMFGAILTAIETNYIERQEAGTLTLSALEAISEIDPGFSVDSDEGTILLIYRDDEVFRADIPAEERIDQWALQADRVLAAARAVSEPLRDASDEKVYGIMFGSMVGLLDRYTRYAGADEAQSNRESRQGFGGIGVSVGPHPLGARVLTVTPSHPAQAAGIHGGDILVSIDGRPLAGTPLRQIIRMLRGPVEKPVVLNISRAGLQNPLTVTVGRTHIVPNTVFFTPKGKAAVIRITAFNDRTPKRVAEAVSEAQAALGPDMIGFILDLRGNPGGLLDKAIDVADLFLHSGTISKTDGRNPRSFQNFEAEPGDISLGKPLAVLIDGATASAAEVLAAALQDQGRGVPIGFSSFGKGTVQTVLDMPNGGELILTWARLLAPSGYVLHEAGVMPTICSQSSVPVDSLLRHALLIEPATTIHNLALRRRVGPNEPAAREHVATLCPWRPEEGPDRAVATAVRLLQSPDLYQTAITLELPPAS